MGTHLTPRHADHQARSVKTVHGHFSRPHRWCACLKVCYARVCIAARVLRSRILHARRRRTCSCCIGREKKKSAWNGEIIDGAPVKIRHGSVALCAGRAASHVKPGVVALWSREQKEEWDAKLLAQLAKVAAADAAAAAAAAAAGEESGGDDDGACPCHIHICE